VRAFRLRACCAERRGEDPAALASGELVDNIVAEHGSELLARRRCLLECPHTQPNRCESAGQQDGNR
jgi:hypothetical protein